MGSTLVLLCPKFGIDINVYQQLSTSQSPNAGAGHAVWAQDEGEGEVGDGDADAGESEGFLSGGEGGEPVMMEDFNPDVLPESEIDAFNPWRAFAGTLLVLALLFFVAWLAKRFGKTSVHFSPVKRMKIAETLSMGMGRQLIMVKVGKSVLIIGSTQSGLTLLDKVPLSELSSLEEEEESPAIKLESDSEPGELSFGERLKKLRSRISEGDE